MNLVTGATGILGAHVVYELLRRGVPVRAGKRDQRNIRKVFHLFELLSPDAQALAGDIEWVDLDVRDIFSIEDALQGVQRVYHCAGLVSFEHRHREALLSVNEGGTRNVVNACLRFPGIELCHVSSVATLHNLDFSAVLDETVFWKRSGRESDYAISKYNAEREVWRGMEEGLRALIVNPGLVLSAGFYDQSSSRMFETTARGNPFYTRGNVAVISARDAARMMVELMEAQAFGERFVLVQQNMPYRELLSRLANAMGTRPPFIELGRTALRLASMAESVLNYFTKDRKRVTRAVINSILNTQKYSADKVKNRLKYEFEPLEKTLDLIALNYKKNRANAATMI